MVDGLSAAAPGDRVAAIEALRFVHLKDATVLARLLDLCADDAPAREVDNGDPFAAFFQAGPTTETRTVGDEAIARLDRAGLPRDAWPALAAALARHPTCRRLQEASARWLAETRWSDPAAAHAALVPPLQAADVPLLAAVAAAGPDARDVLIDRALAPWHDRTVQELLNHREAHDATLEAIEARLADGRLVPTEAQALLLLGLLAGWESPALPRVAGVLEARHPWAVAYLALDDAEAVPRLRQWLAAGPSTHAAVGVRVVEALRQRPRVEGWPLAAWVEHFDLPASAFGAWGLDDAAAELLARRLDGLAATDDATRLEAWNAAGLLVLEGLHADHLDTIDAALARELPWDADFVARLAAGRPRLPRLGAAIARAVRDHDDPAPALAAAHDLDDDALGPVVDAVLALAARRPEVRRPAGPGLERIRREGIDTDRLEPLVARVATPDREAALDRVRPVVRGVEA